MKKLILLYLISSSVTSLNAQDSLYSKVLYNNSGYKGYAVKTDANSNIVHVGMTNYNYGAFSLLDSLGNILNASQYTVDGQPSSNFEFHDVEALSDGNYLAVGTVMLQNFGVNVGVIAKLSNSGSVIWSKGVYPQAPVFFNCSAVMESSENTYWIAGSDVQSGEMVIAELDTDGTTLQVSSYKNSGIRFNVENIMEYDANTVLFSGYALDNSGIPQGMVFATDNMGMLLWSNIKPNYKFYDMGMDNNTIRIAAFCNGSPAKIGIVSVLPAGTFTTIQEADYFSKIPEAVDMAHIKDSSYLISSGNNFDSRLDFMHVGQTIAEQKNYMGLATDVTSREHNGAYISAYGPIYGVKSASWYAIPHGNIVRTDSMLTINDCTFGEGTLPTIVSGLSDQTMTFTSITSASIMDMLINQSPNDLNDSISCVDFYSGINENTYKNINVYPNPSNGSISIDLEGAEGMITILDPQGKTVLNAKLGANTSTVNIGSLSEGMYLYVIEDLKHQVIGKGKLIRN